MRRCLTTPTAACGIRRLHQFVRSSFSVVCSSLGCSFQLRIRPVHGATATAGLLRPAHIRLREVLSPQRSASRPSWPRRIVVVLRRSWALVCQAGACCPGCRWGVCRGGSSGVAAVGLGHGCSGCFSLPLNVVVLSRLVGRVSPTVMPRLGAVVVGRHRLVGRLVAVDAHLQGVLLLAPQVAVCGERSCDEEGEAPDYAADDGAHGGGTCAASCR